MLTAILSHTPLYVWAILALLVYRGVIALRTREVAVNKLFIIPAVMLALSLFDVWAKFGLGGPAVVSWLLAGTATLALLWTLGAERVAPSATAGHVTVRGSAWPLVLMVAIFLTKYLTSVAVAMQPAWRHDLAFTVAVCALFGVFNGYFLGRLARDLKASVAFERRPAAGARTI